MKQISNIKKVLALSIVLLSGSLISRAGTNEPREPVNKRSGNVIPAEVIYIGSHEGQSLFNVLYDNRNGARFSIKILDNEGHQLFQAVYTDRKFDKKFKVTDALSYSKLIFVIRNFRDNSVQRFIVPRKYQENSSNLEVIN